MNDLQQLATDLLHAAQALGAQVTSIWFYLQITLIALAGAIAWGAAVLLRRRTDLVSATMGWPAYARLAARAVAHNIGTVIFVLATALMRSLMVAYTWPSRSYLISVATSLASAWLIIHLIASLIRNRFIVRVVAVTAWTVAALSILGVLESTLAALDSVAIVIGGLRLSPLVVIKLSIFTLLTVWAAIGISNFLERRIGRAPDLTPSIRVLIGKLVRLTLITGAVLIVLGAAGIDLSALAIFSGAVGVGIGFGLQKIVSNFVSGVILLADKSIKPGDVVSVADSYGWVSGMNTRYISVVTRDGREVLIPNEDLVTQRVTNWSYTRDEIRLDVTFSINQDERGDPHRVSRLAVAAAAGVARVLAKPAPVCHFVSYDAKALNFLLRFWINDPIQGTTNVRSAVLLAVWDALKREGIAVPSQVQDTRLLEPLRVVVDGGGGLPAEAAPPPRVTD